MKIRALEWELAAGCALEAAAFGLDVFYRIEGEPGEWTLISPGPRQYVRTPGYETQADAKHAAWVDFDRRIRAEIETST